MSKIVLLDCDGPLVNDNTWCFFNYANEERGYNWSYADYCRIGNWQTATRVAAGVVNRIYEEFVRCHSFPGYWPTVGASVVLAKVLMLKRVIATSRSHELADQTRDFLAEHYDGGFVGYHLGLQHKAVTLRDKYDIACLVDDNANEIRLAYEAGVRAYLFPTRNFYHNNGVPSETLLEAESLVHGGMSDKEWERTCAVAWEQLGDIMSARLAE